MFRAVIPGVIAGGIAALLFHQGATSLMFHMVPTLQAWVALPDALQPVAPGFSLRPAPPFGLPLVVMVCFWGAAWGALLALLIHLLQLPELLAGFLFGALVFTLAGFSMSGDLRGVPAWGVSQPAHWIQAALVNGAWGWGTAGLLRALRLAWD